MLSLYVFLLRDATRLVCLRPNMEGSTSSSMYRGRTTRAKCSSPVQSAKQHTEPDKLDYFNLANQARHFDVAFANTCTNNDLAFTLFRQIKWILRLLFDDIDFLNKSVWLDENKFKDIRHEEEYGTLASLWNVLALQLVRTSVCPQVAPLLRQLGCSAAETWPNKP